MALIAVITSFEGQKKSTVGIIFGFWHYNDIGALFQLFTYFKAWAGNQSFTKWGDKRFGKVWNTGELYISWSEF